MANSDNSTTVGELLADAIGKLSQTGTETPRLDAEVLLSAATGLERASLIADPTHSIGGQQAAQFMEFVARRSKDEPVAYILGRKYFRNIELMVDRRVLIPRPETEGVVEAALSLPHGATVIDVGTGSGAIALGLKDQRPDLEVIATDISSDALAVAQANAKRLGLQIDFRLGDLLKVVQGPVDAVVSNPPYVAERERDSLAPGVINYEPFEALFAGEDGLDVFRPLIEEVGDSAAWFIAFEVGDRQAHVVAKMLQRVGFHSTEIKRDLAGIERVVVARRDTPTPLAR